MFPRLFKRALSTNVTELKPKVLVGNEKYILGIVLGMSMFSIGTYLDMQKTITKLEYRIDNLDNRTNSNNIDIYRNMEKLKKEIDATNKTVDTAISQSKDVIKGYNNEFMILNEKINHLKNRI
jgi:peptidoglycan hydrolase CwlO-like protein